MGQTLWIYMLLNRFSHGMAQLSIFFIYLHVSYVVNLRKKMFHFILKTLLLFYHYTQSCLLTCRNIKANNADICRQSLSGLPSYRD